MTKYPGKIYVSSKVRHAHLWRNYRDYGGIPIISGWIDMEAPTTPEGSEELWDRCLIDIARASALFLYSPLEPDDRPLMGALVEVGAAMAWGIPIFYVGIPGRYTFEPLMRRCHTIEEALWNAAYIEKR